MPVIDGATPGNDFRAWLQATPGNAWALDYAGNDPDFESGGGINAPKLFNAYGDAGAEAAANRIKSLYTTYKTTLGARTDAPGLSTNNNYNPAEDVSFLNDQEAKLRGLLGRADTNLSQGLQKNEDAYTEQVGGANRDKELKVIEQNKGKQNAYDTIDRNAGNGYRSLAQIIGRSAGTGSSAYKELLPNVIGKDTSSKRFDTTNTYGQNLSNIDTSFEGVLADLLKQKKANEESVRTGVEGQKQDLNSKLAEVASKRAQARGGGFAQVQAARAPFDQAIENSRNTVESFFNQFRTPYTPQAINPNLAAYQVDRSAVNAPGQGGSADNPYASLLRKKLQERA